MADRRRSIGKRGEDIAVRRLVRSGARVLARNVRTRHGEIDAIVLDDGWLCFVEVKTLAAGAGWGPERPAFAVTPAKRLRIRRLAAAWLADAGRLPRLRGIRFDVIGIRLDRAGAVVEYEHLQGAF